MHHANNITVNLHIRTQKGSNPPSPLALSKSQKWH